MSVPDSLEEFKWKGDLIGGNFLKPNDVQGEWISRNPGNLSDELGKIQYSYASINKSVDAAREAFDSWRGESATVRRNLIKKYQETVFSRGEEFVLRVARETGKPLWEGKRELESMLDQIELSLTEAEKFVADFQVSLQSGQPGRTGMCRHRPLGVVAIVTSFDSPGAIPSAQLVNSLLSGNTVVFKPSEKASFVGQWLAECFAEAGFPPGVINMIQGEKEVGRRLCVHEEVNAVLFTGSSEVGARIKQDILHQHWKILILAMGGKNSVLVWEDAPLDVALYETLTGAFTGAGQRCTSTSRIVVHRKLLDEFINRFHQQTKLLTIGHPLDNPFMGPLIDSSSVDRYMKFLGIAVREGCEWLMRGKALDLPWQGHFVTPSICLAQNTSLSHIRKSVYHQTEFFAPNVLIIGTDDLHEAIQIMNSTQYGLVASVFTQNRSVYEQCLLGIEAGLIHWNEATHVQALQLPFRGLKKSGNYFPVATASPLYTVPVSSVEISSPVLNLHKPDGADRIPGLNWTK